MKLIAFIDSRHVVGGLTVTAPRELPYAAASMLTALAGDVRGHVQKRLPEAFDRPTEFTVKGVYSRGATRAKLEAEIYFPESREESGKAKREYIRPGAKGTAARRQKKTEFLLSRIGALPPGWVTTPGKGAKLDAHGNLAGSVYKQIINVLQIRYNKPKPISGRSQKAAQRLGVPALFFVVNPGPNQLAKGGGWLPPGVWKNLPGRQITQILKFVKRAGYKPRIDLKKEAAGVLRRQIGPRWREAALRIARKFAQRG